MRPEPCTVKAAERFVAQWHRKLPRVQGAMWAVRALDDAGDVRGVAMVGWPARVWSPLAILCVLRVAVMPESQNACSVLYGACSRAAKGMGARGLVTYTLQEETGVSLRAANWIDGGLTDGGEYDRPSRERAPALFPEPKRRWWAPWSKIPETCSVERGER